MFKDEAGGKQIVEFVGLRAKQYLVDKECYKNEYSIRRLYRVLV